MYTQTSIMSLALLFAGSAIAAPYGALSNVTATKTTMITSVLSATASAINHAQSSSAIPSATCSSADPNPTLFEKLTLAPNAAARVGLLSDSDFIFDFNDNCRTQGVTAGQGGKTVRADHATFPALVGQGASYTIGFLGPCGFNTPHVHPRAAELNLVVEGRLFASVTAENGARHMNHTLNKFQMTVFPQGALHTEFNPDCTPATFVAAFGNEDPGVGQIAQEYFGLENEIIKGSIGGEIAVDGADIDAFRSKIPANVAKGVDSCLAKCNIAKR